MKEPKIYYINSNLLPFFRGFCIPWIGIIIKKEHKDNKKLIEHEKIHLKQIKRMGIILYVIRYVVQLIFIGYDTMPMELEARQNEESLWNYRDKWN